MTGRLAARAVTLAFDAATSAEDAANHLRSSRSRRHDGATALNRAARRVEHRHPHPDSALARHGIRMLRTARALSAVVTSPPGATSGAVTWSANARSMGART